MSKWEDHIKSKSRGGVWHADARSKLDLPDSKLLSDKKKDAKLEKLVKEGKLMRLGKNTYRAVK